MKRKKESQLTSVNVYNNDAFKMQSARWDTNMRAAAAAINKLPVSV